MDIKKADFSLARISELVGKKGDLEEFPGAPSA